MPPATIHQLEKVRQDLWLTLESSAHLHADIDRLARGGFDGTKADHDAVATLAMLVGIELRLRALRRQSN